MLIENNKLSLSANLGFNKFWNFNSQSNIDTSQTSQKDRSDQTVQDMHSTKVSICPFPWKCLSDTMALSSLFENANPEFSYLDE
jgi:hypothetical protein